MLAIGLPVESEHFSVNLFLKHKICGHYVNVRITDFFAIMTEFDYLRLFVVENERAFIYNQNTDNLIVISLTGQDYGNKQLLIGGDHLHTPERHKQILDLLKTQHFVTIRDLVEETSSSESTIRRDLSQLEHENKLLRFHGGAQAIQSKSVETSIGERTTERFTEKHAIAEYAVAKLEKGDCIFLDAGTTTSHIIPLLREDIIVVTNGISLIQPCLERDLEVYLIGGKIKNKTNALIGTGAVESLKSYRFDKAFIGINGVHPKYGLTTPDPEEAQIKRLAMELSSQAFVLADASKFGQVTFSHVQDLSSAVIITDDFEDEEELKMYRKKAKIEVVKK